MYYSFEIDYINGKIRISEIDLSRNFESFGIVVFEVVVVLDFYQAIRFFRETEIEEFWKCAELYWKYMYRERLKSFQRMVFGFYCIILFFISKMFRIFELYRKILKNILQFSFSNFFKTLKNITLSNDF